MIGHDVPMLGSTTSVTLVALVAALVGGGCVLVAARRRGVDARVVFGGGAAAGVVVAAGLVVMAVQGTGAFGVAHLLYLAAVLTVPLIGVVVLGARAVVPVRRAATALAVVAILPAPLGFYATHVAPYRLRVERLDVELESARVGQDRVVVAVLSDIQTVEVGDHERAAVQAVLDADPDVILVPGDLFQGRFAQLMEQGPVLRELLSSLEAPGGVYFVQGDVDREDRMHVILEGTGIEVLDDEVVRVEVGDRRLVIGGTRKDYRSAAAAAVRDELVSVAGAEEITVMLSHRPDAVLELPPGSGIDLTVAGHTHGGQIALPLFGPLVTLSEVPRHVGAGGLHEVADNRIYVSPGVGMERGRAPQLRLGVPPTVAILELG